MPIWTSSSSHPDHVMVTGSLGARYVPVTQLREAVSSSSALLGSWRNDYTLEAVSDGSNSRD